MARTRSANIVSFAEARDNRARASRARTSGRRSDEAAPLARSTSLISNRAKREEPAESDRARTSARTRTRARAGESRQDEAAPRARMTRSRTSQQEAEELASQPTSRERRRRERTKERAGRMYSRQFSDEASTAEPEEGTPRAAVYEGKMGSSHRKSARMQRSSSAGPVSAKLNPAGWLSSSKLTERTLKIATGALCVILACAFLYVPAQQYYQAQREHDRLVAEYDIISKRNDALDVQNDILASDAGIEDAVREKYGYVKYGEQTAVVTGLSDEATNNSRRTEGIEGNVLSSSVKASEEWYTPLLDAFFGVQ